MKSKISVVIHTFNSESDIHECIDSAKFLSDSVTVVDMQSSDQTISIVKNLGIKLLSFPKSEYVEPAREFGFRQSDSDWILILDDDERITTQLADEILHLNLKNDLTCTHYKIPRKNIFGGVRWLKHGGWWPDYQIRLINKKFFKSWPKAIHSTPAIEGNFAYLKNPILHYFHGDPESMVEKTIIFENIESGLLFKADKKTGTLIFFRKFLAELFRRLIGKMGFLDGSVGIIESIYQAFSKTITYIYLYEKRLSLERQSRTL